MSTALTIPLSVQGRNEFDKRVEASCGGPLDARAIDTIQVNIGLTCDLACRHCHVASSPKRTEQMSWQTMMLVIDAAGRAQIKSLDITGGAPEMNPNFQRFVKVARCKDLRVLVRTNLTIMLREGYGNLPEFYRDNGVHLIASLPCYLPENVKQQRGTHVYENSVEVIRRLNAVGYGRCEDLPLDLVYNPLGPALPPDQARLEGAYRVELKNRFGLQFSRLIAITNMPIGRFLRDLERSGEHERYHQLLRDSFNTETIDGLMCRSQIHVSWDGTLHDCDFNYALALPTNHGAPTHIRDFDPSALAHRRIATGEHCFGCTAGHGSSCQGALT